MDSMHIYSGYEANSKIRHFKALYSLGELHNSHRHKNLKFLLYSRLMHFYNRVVKKKIVKNLFHCGRRIRDLPKDHTTFSFKKSFSVFPNLKICNINLEDYKSLRRLYYYRDFDTLRITCYTKNFVQEAARRIKDTLLRCHSYHNLKINGIENCLAFIQKGGFLDRNPSVSLFSEDILFEKVNDETFPSVLKQVNHMICYFRPGLNDLVFTHLKEMKNVAFLELNFVVETVSLMERFFAAFYLPENLKTLRMRFDYWDWKEFQENPLVSTEYGRNFVHQLTKLTNLEELRISSESEGHTNKSYPFPVIYQMVSNNKNLKQLEVVTFDYFPRSTFLYTSDHDAVINLGKIMNLVYETGIKLDTLHFQGNISTEGLLDSPPDYKIKNQIAIRGLVMDVTTTLKLFNLISDSTSIEFWGWRVKNNQELRILAQGLLRLKKKIPQYLDIYITNVTKDDLKEFIDTIGQEATISLNFSFDFYTADYTNADFADLARPPHRVRVAVKPLNV